MYYIKHFRLFSVTALPILVFFKLIFQQKLVFNLTSKSAETLDVLGQQHAAAVNKPNGLQVTTSCMHLSRPKPQKEIQTPCIEKRLKNKIVSSQKPEFEIRTRTGRW